MKMHRMLAHSEWEIVIIGNTPTYRDIYYIRALPFTVDMGNTIGAMDD